jgi:hypothetical protein
VNGALAVRRASARPAGARDFAAAALGTSSVEKEIFR